MTNYTLAVQMQQLKDKGMTQAQIGRELGCDKGRVNRLLGPNCDTEQWEIERQAAVEFFKGLTPQQEYDQHTARRNALKQQFKDELI